VHSPFHLAFAWVFLLMMTLIAQSACSPKSLPSPVPAFSTFTQTPMKTETASPTPTSPPEENASQGVNKKSSFESPVLGRPFEYEVYLPDGYEANSLHYPVIYLLHGRGDTMYSWEFVKPDLDRMIREGQIPPIIAVLPDFPSSKRASYFVDSLYTDPILPGEKVETAFFQDLVPHIDATYRTITDRSGRAIAGYSMGGYGAVRYPLAHPEVFSAAIVLSPAVYVPLPPNDSSTRLYGAFGNGDQIFDADIFTAKNYPALIPSFEAHKLPLYMYIAVGDDEWRNPLPEDYEHDLDFEAHRLYNKITRAHYVVSEFRVLDGGHDTDVWQPAFVEGLTYISRFLAAAR
jgi:enterochelin esterase-like enzyme